ncbi:MULTISPECIES: hypothetical protein [unclassified Pseudomonas]|uniref:hypothetical protein n=1 Tax=unclassified Pseudomonas TaxID=196821 RepID=UPI0011AF2349|nr:MULTISPECIES: hypothetical protein [unclassified Pseudomonas]
MEKRIQKGKETVGANGNACYLLPLIILEKFPGRIVSICVLIEMKWIHGRFDRFPKQTKSHSSVFRRGPQA